MSPFSSHHHRAPRIFGTVSFATVDALTLGAVHDTDAVNWGADEEPVPFTLTGVGVKDAVVLLTRTLGCVAFACWSGLLLVLGAYHQSVVTPTGKVYFA